VPVVVVAAPVSFSDAPWRIRNSEQDIYYRRADIRYLIPAFGGPGGPIGLPGGARSGGPNFARLAH
jgi:hypothetical protein